MSYKGGQRLKNDAYRDFVLSHVLRPFQSMITDDDKVTLKKFYNRIPDLIHQNPEWWELVIDRLSRCFSSIEEGFLARDRVGYYIRMALEDKGVEFNAFEIK